MIKKYNEMNEWVEPTFSIKDLVKIIVEYRKKIREYEQLSHNIDDCVGLSDEDCFDVGKISGRISTLQSVISDI